MCVLLFLTSILGASIDLTSSERIDNNAPRYTRIQSSLSSEPSQNRYNMLLTSQIDPTSDSTKSQSSSSSSSAQKQVIIQTAKPTAASSVKNSGSTVYDVQEQMQPPSINAGHYVFSMTPSTGGTTQGFIPTGRHMFKLA